MLNEKMKMRQELHELQTIVGLGANLPGRWGTPAQTLAEAVRRLAESDGVELLRLSRLWRSAAYGGVPQPPFVNAVALLRTRLSPQALLKLLMAVERAAGRRRGVAWGARVLDLDLVDHGGRVMRPPGVGRLGGAKTLHRLQRRGLILPHPDVRARAFVLVPLAEVWPEWRHPVTGESLSALLARLPARERTACRPLPASTQEWALLQSLCGHNVSRMRTAG